MRKKTLSSGSESQRNTLTDDQLRFLNELKRRGPNGIGWQEVDAIYKSLQCNREEIEELLLHPDKLKVQGCRIIHPDFKDTIYS